MLDTNTALNSQAELMKSGSVYTDLQGLSGLKRLGKQSEESALRSVAQQFESMFVHMMLKSMRAANKAFQEGNLLHSFESDMHQQMLDHQMSLSLSEGQGIGLADVLFKQMQQQYSRPAVQGNAEETGKVAADEFRRSVGGINLSALHSPAGQLVHSMLNEQQSVSQLEKTKAQETSRMADTLFDTPAQFIRRLLPELSSAARHLGLDVKALVSQAALETGWGKRVIERADGQSSHNLFGIKADKSWDGNAVRVPALEYRQGLAERSLESFRAYDSFAESAMDYVNFLKSNPRYQRALSITENVAGFWQELQNAGYATDPNYADKLLNIYRNIDIGNALSME